jgi:flagellar hook-associated protein 2
MVQITSTNGLVSGIDYSTLINNLIKADSATSDAITAQNKTLQSQQTAITALIANLTAIKGTTDALGKPNIFDANTATSSNSNVISVQTTGLPTAGTYQYTALNRAQNQQSISTGYASADSAIGQGTFSLRFGNGVDASMSLDDINGGTGFTAGKIKITDRSGASAVIDLTAAKTIDDVLDAINDNGLAYVTASVAGDTIVLTDNTGETTSNLKVQEVNSGKTASSLGLAGINIASNSAAGSDIVYLSNNLKLSALNDGIGVETNTSLAGIRYTLSNSDTGEIDLSGAQTIGDVINKINAASQYLKASISLDGSRLILTDSSGGTATPFTVIDDNGSNALKDLGLTGTAVGGVITGRRIISGAKTVLLSDLNGGSGLGALGKITITDRAGNSTDVDLSNAETLQDVIGSINDAASSAPTRVKITAQVNDAGNGIELVDSSGATAGNLKVDNYDDGTSTAAKIFGSAVDVAADTANSGDLHLQVIGLNTQLADLNGGNGVALGKFTITDSAGKSADININSSVKTIGDVVKAINLSTIGVLAEINQSGDGIVIQDTAGKTGTLAIVENGSTTAADLNLLGTATTQDSTQVIVGAMTRTIDISDADTLQTLTDKINNLNAGVTASIVSDGSDTPYHLSIVGNNTGKQGQFILDSSRAGMSFDQFSQAQDALLAVGSYGSSNKTMLVSSSTNSFVNVIQGATLTIQNVSYNPVTVTVASDTTNLATQIQSFVNSYNTFRKTLNTYTAYDASTNTAAALTGNYSALQTGNRLSNLISGSFTANKTIQSLAQLGITLNSEDGSLSLNQQTLDSVLGANLADVKEMFTAADTGVSAQFSNVIQGLAGDNNPFNENNALLELQNAALQTSYDNNQKRIDNWTNRLAAERSRLTAQFANLELTLAKMQTNFQALNSISWMLDTSSNSSSNSLFGNTSSS